MISLQESLVRSLALLVLVLLVPLGRASAQGPPIQTDTPIMLGIQGRGIRTFVKVVRMDKRLSGGDEIEDPTDRSVTAFIYPLVVPYNLTTTTQAGIITPFITKNMTSNGGDDSRSGLGDVTAFLKQLIVRVDRRAETFRVAVKGTVKFPTGDDSEMLPLGSGAFDYGFSAVAGWIKSRWGLYDETIYVRTTSNDGVDFGDRFAYNAALGFRVLPTRYTHYPQPQLNLFIELNGNVVGRTEASGVENPDSGGSLVFLSPGLQYVGGRRWLIEASVQVPVINEPNGTQLGTGWTASLGTRILVF